MVVVPVYNCILTDSDILPPVEEIEEDLGDNIEAKTPSAAAKAFVIAECEASGVTEDAGFILVGSDDGKWWLFEFTANLKATATELGCSHPT